VDDRRTKPGDQQASAAEIKASDSLEANKAPQQNEIEALRAEVQRLRAESRSTAWERTLLARHEQRPYTLDYVERLFLSFSEIHGDRRFGDDPAIVAGMARYHGRPVMVVGHQ
jgi:acetyl-CoA carboxylase carboxyl transferase subunit alpha